MVRHLRLLFFSGCKACLLMAVEGWVGGLGGDFRRYGTPDHLALLEWSGGIPGPRVGDR